MAWFRCRERHGKGVRLLVAPSLEKARVYAVELGLKAPLDCEEYTEVLAAKAMVAIAETADVVSEVINDAEMQRQARTLKREAYELLKHARGNKGVRG